MTKTTLVREPPFEWRRLTPRDPASDAPGELEVGSSTYIYVAGIELQDFGRGRPLLRRHSWHGRKAEPTRSREQVVCAVLMARLRSRRRSLRQRGVSLNRSERHGTKRFALSSYRIRKSNIREIVGDPQRFRCYCGNCGELEDGVDQIRATNVQVEQRKLAGPAGKRGPVKPAADEAIGRPKRSALARYDR